MTLAIRNNTLACLAALVALGTTHAAAARQPLVRTTSGVVQGRRDSDAELFRGIPYAAPPIGPLRWKPPQPAHPWPGVLKADRFAPACPQPAGADGAPNFGLYAGPTSEDCLTLNVWKPKGARRAPVLVVIHGGGHRFGSGGVALYDGSAFARDGIVVVSFNYRLGGLGYFAHPALTREARPGEPLGNYGLMDQIAALQWVRRDIAAFGGDPGNVTVAGQSSSAIDVQALMAIPRAARLFDKAIIESGGSWTTPVALHESEAAGEKLAAAAGLARDKATPAALRALPADAFLDPAYAFDFQPIVDGRLMTGTSTQAFADDHAAAKPMIIGSNSFEGAIARNFSGLGDLPSKLGALYPGGGKSEADLRALYGDRFFGAPSRWVAAQASRRASAWLYVFSYVPEHLRQVLPGAPHGFESGFVYDSWDRSSPSLLAIFAGSPSGPTAQDRETTARLHACWAAFVKTGRPDCPGGPEWPAYSASTDQIMDFDAQPGIQTHWRKLQYDALEREVLPGLLKPRTGSR